MKIRDGIVLAMGLFLLNSCQEKGMEILRQSYSKVDEIPQDRWDALAQRKIFFGHKSVGANILEGLKEVMAQRPNIKLNIRETVTPPISSSPYSPILPSGGTRSP